MADNTLTSFDPALKQLYKDSNVEKLVFQKRPLLGMLPKFEGFYGRNMPIVQVYGHGQGISTVFATAQANASIERLEDFLLTRVNRYKVATITGEVVDASRGDSGAFLQALKQMIDGAFAAFSDDLESRLFRSTSGSLAQILSTTGANPDVITLLQIEDITNFEVGMVLVANNTDDAATLRATPASHTIAKVNRSLGTITTSADGAGTDWAANDYLFRQGDPAVTLAGLASWLPAAAPSGGESYFGVDRSVDSRLYGQLHVGTSGTLEDNLIDAASKVGREGGNLDKFIVHHAQYRRLAKEMESRKVFADVNAQSARGSVANVSYKGMEIQGDGGPAAVVASSKCQAVVGWGLDLSSWMLASIGPVVKILMEDDLKILRQAAADGYELRLGSRSNLGCKAPIRNIRISLPTP